MCIRDSPNTYDPAVRSLDRAFNTQISATRESGRTPNPQLFSVYSDQIQKASLLQAEEYRKTKNQEEITNAGLRAQADQLNAQIEQSNNAADLQVQSAKAGLEAQAIAKVEAGVANISNMMSRNVANKFQAEITAQEGILTQEELAKINAAKLEKTKKKRQLAQAKSNVAFKLEMKDDLAAIDATIEAQIDELPKAPDIPQLSSAGSPNFDMIDIDNTIFSQAMDVTNIEEPFYQHPVDYSTLQRQREAKLRLINPAERYKYGGFYNQSIY